MIKLKGAGLKDKRLSDFIRMIQTSIPQQSFSYIDSDTTIVINQNRRITKLITNKNSVMNPTPISNLIINSIFLNLFPKSINFIQ